MARQSFIFLEKEKMFYHKNGYVVIDGVFSSDECDEAVKVFEKYARSDYRGIMNMDRGGTLTYKDIINDKEVEESLPIRQSDADTVRLMMKHPIMVSVLETLQAKRVDGLQTMFLFKKAGSPYALQAWNPHQDNTYPRAPYGAYITGNIAFADQDPANGGMYIFPGSHNEDLLEVEEVRSFHEKPGSSPGHKILRMPEKYKKTDLYLAKGSVLFLHGNVIHGSYSNITKARSRPMLLIPYISQGVDFISGKVAQRIRIPLR